MPKDRKRDRRDALGVFLITVLPLILIVGFVVYAIYVMSGLS